MTTLINRLNNIYDTDSDEDEDNLPDKILNLSNSLEIRVNALEKYYSEVSDNCIEILSTLSGMYQMSGSKLIEQFFYRICVNSTISSFLKFEAAKNLLEYEDSDENHPGENYQEENHQEENQNSTVRNTSRKLLGYNAINHLCKNFIDIPTPCRVEAILRLMECPDFQKQADKYFRDFVRDSNINCVYRYKTILSLEKVNSDILKSKLVELFDDKSFVDYFYDKLKSPISKMFPGLKLINTNNKLWVTVISKLAYEDVKPIYKSRYPSESHMRDFFIQNAHSAFLFHDKNDIYYRIMSGQYLLQNCTLNESTRFMIENKLLDFAKDDSIDYDRRADSADILLKLGSPSMKQHSKDIIMELGNIMGNTRTIFDNAQNVHTQEVEESVSEALEFLSNIPTLKKVTGVITGTETDHFLQEGNDPIDFEYVNMQVEEMLKEDRDCLYILSSINSGKVCSHCNSNIDKVIVNDDKIFCSNECLRFFYRDIKIRLAMNRIFIDRALYSKYNSSLVNILLKIWSYLIGNENEQEMRKRLLEELEEMSGTCSSGFATRLVNVISGFGDFNIRISWEDQIIANFAGRLNAAARKITSDDSIFRTKKLNDVIELWLYANRDVKNEIETKLNPDYTRLEKRITMSDIISEFISVDKETKIQTCIEDFSEYVLNEMTVISSNHEERQNFSLFLRTYISIIREELSVEFKDLIDTNTFDMAFRQAICRYEGS